MEMGLDGLARFKKRAYDILENRDKLEPQSAVGVLSKQDSAVLACLGIAAEQMRDDILLEMALEAVEGLAGTLLTIYEHGIPEGAQLNSPVLQRVADIMVKAGEYDRSASKD